MTKLFKPGGAISVFLVIILVPCLVVCFLFVDLSRYELSKSSVESSADTALNSLMANFDTMLCDYYGLVGSVQNIDEFYDKSEEFFAKTLQANGISDESSNEIISWIFNEIRGGDDYSDLIQVSMVADSNSMVAASGSGLGEDPILIKEGIVEFMKYRAPELLLESVYQKLIDGGDTLKNDLENASKDAKLSEARDNFAEAEGELSKKEFFTYYYYEEYAKLGIKEVDLETAQTRGDDSYYSYKDITKDSVAKYWIKQDGFPGSLSNDNIGYNGPVKKDDGFEYFKAWGLSTDDIEKCKADVASCDSSDYDTDDDSSDESSEETTEEPDPADLTYYISLDDFNTYKNTLENKITALKNALSAADSAVANFKGKDYGDGDNQTNKEQWYYFANKALVGGDTNHVTAINSAGSEVAIAMVNLRAVMQCSKKPEDEQSFPSDWVTQGDTQIQKAKDLLNGVFSASGQGYSDGSTTYGADYLTVKRHVIEIRSTVYNSCDSSTANSTLQTTSSGLQESRQKIQTALDALRVVIYGDDDKRVASLDDIVDLANDYELKYLAWQAECENPSTTLAHSQNEELETYKMQERDVKESDILEFKRRLQCVESLLQGVIDSLDSIIFNTQKVLDISSYGTYYGQFSGVFTRPTAPMTNSDIQITSDQIIDDHFHPNPPTYGSSYFNLSNLSYSDYKLILEQGDDTYYDSLINKYSEIANLDKAKDGVEDEEDRLDQYEEDQKSKEEDAEANNNADDVAVGANVNNDECSGDPFDVGDLITGFANTISSFINLDMGARDTLYATMYAMNMFSYRTYVYEGKSKMHYSKSGAEEITLENCDTIYDGLSSDWANDDLTVTLNKTLTNRLINASNNKANNAEIEYILFGGTNTENLASAYTGIYLLRYALNLASGFINFYTVKDNNPTAAAIEAVAQAVFAATSGIIPAPVTKCILIALLTALETIHDMQVLLKGLPLPVYKMKADDWACSFSNPGTSHDTTPSTDDSKVSKDGFCMTYGDYMYVFLFCALSSEMAPKAYQRLGRLIECNMQLAKSDDSYDLKKAKTMFTFESNLEVKPLMLDLPLASEYTDGIGESSWNKYYLEMTRGY